MQYETQVVDVTEEELEELKAELLAWKDEYGDIYITEFEDEQSFIWRCLSRKEFNRAVEYFEDDYDRADYVCKLCILDPVGIDYSIDIPAGIPEVLTENILRQSGFTADSKEMDQLMGVYENEMRMFSNQMSCVIVEVFPHLSLEEVDNWNQKKMIWYYSRAKWTLETLRGVKLEREDGVTGGTAAPDGTMVKGDPRDFPELLR